MKYTKFIIKNYKGIPKIKLDLTKKPGSDIFTLIGLNESGKTSILEAIYLFQKNISEEEAHTLIPKSKQYLFNETISVTANLELNNNDFKELKKHLKNTHEYRLDDSLDKIIAITIEYEFKNSKIFAKNKYWDFNLKGKIKNTKKLKKLSNDVRLLTRSKDLWDWTRLKLALKMSFQRKPVLYEDCI